MQNPEILNQLMIMGELGLEGDIRPIKGILSMAMLAREQNLAGFICPMDNANEASIIRELPVYGANNLKDAVAILRNPQRLAHSSPNIADLINQNPNKAQADFSDVKGQEQIKRVWRLLRQAGIIC